MNTKESWEEAVENTDLSVYEEGHRSSYDVEALKNLVKEQVDIAYRRGWMDAKKEDEKTFGRLFAAAVAKNGGEFRWSDMDNVLDEDKWVMERYHDDNVMCTVFKIYERKV